jgi:ferrochelatase
VSFRTEPPFRHGQAARTALVLVNLGTPDAPTAPALRRYLAEFLSDPRVVEIPRLLWWPILHGIILRTRPVASAAKYASVWMPEGSPLAVWTQRQTSALAACLADRGHDLVVRHAMRYGSPAVSAVLDELRAAGATRVLVLPLYPQFAAATTASVTDSVMLWARAARRVPEFRFIAEYHDDPGYIAALATRLQSHWREKGRAEKLVLSFHGVPQRSLALGDPYHCQCHKTARRLAEHLGLGREELLVTFQSRFGKAKWLEPYTEPTLRDLAARGVKSVDVMCPGFVADCLETLEEIAQEAREAFLEAGGEAFGYVPCLNDEPSWVAAMADLCERHLAGWDTRSVPADPDRVLQRQGDLKLQRELALALGATD